MPIAMTGKKYSADQLQPNSGAYDIAKAVYSGKSFDVGSEETGPQGIAWNSDGTMLFVVGNTNDNVYEYNLTTPYDLTTASYSGKTLDVSNEDSGSQGIAWNSDGSKLFLVGNINNSIHEYNLSTPYDISTASYSGNSLNVGNEDGVPTGIAWKDDGFKLFMTGLAADRIHEYNLSTPYDVSTASYSGNNLNVSSEDSVPTGIAWNSDGSKLFLVGNGNDSIYEYNLTTPYDITTASFTGKSFDMSSEGIGPDEITWNPDGSKLFMVGSGSDSVHEYDVGDAALSFNVNKLTYSGNSFDVGSEEGNPRGFAWNSDGSKLFMVGNQSGVHEYNVTTPYDITTASYSGNVLDVFSEDSFPYKIEWNSDGSKLFMVGISNDNIYEYNLTTPYDITTASYSGNSFSVSNEDVGPRAIAWNSDGTKLFMVGDSNDNIYEYNLTTPYDITSASYSGNILNVVSEDSFAGGIVWNSEGSKLFFVGYSNGSVHEYNLTTPYDITTASYSGNNLNVNSEDGIPIGIAWNSSGSKLFMIGDGNNSIYEYTI